MRRGPQHTFMATQAEFADVMRALVRFDHITDRLLAALLPLEGDHSPAFVRAMDELKASIKEGMSQRNMDVYAKAFDFLDSGRKGFVTEDEFHALLDVFVPRKREMQRERVRQRRGRTQAIRGRS